jgi:hypothetical protein
MDLGKKYELRLAAQKIGDALEKNSSASQQSKDEGIWEIRAFFEKSNRMKMA